MMKLQKKCEEAPKQGLHMNNERCFYILHTLPCTALLHPASSLSYTFQSTPAILSRIRVKERRGCSDAGLTQTRHTPRHVTGFTTMKQLCTECSSYIQACPATDTVDFPTCASTRNGPSVLAYANYD